MRGKRNRHGSLPEFDRIGRKADTQQVCQQTTRSFRAWISRQSAADERIGNVALGSGSLGLERGDKRVDVFPAILGGSNFRHLPSSLRVSFKLEDGPDIRRDLRPEALLAEIDLTRTSLLLSSKPGIRVNALRARLEDKSARV